MLRAISFLALLAGLVTGKIAGAILVVVGTVTVELIAPVAAESEPRITEALATSTPHILAALAASLGSALIGGFVAAWVAPRNPIQHAVAVGVLMVIFSAVGYEAHNLQLFPFWYVASSFGFTIPFAYAGARFRGRERAAA